MSREEFWVIERIPLKIHRCKLFLKFIEQIFISCIVNFYFCCEIIIDLQDYICKFNGFILVKVWSKRYTVGCTQTEIFEFNFILSWVITQWDYRFKYYFEYDCMFRRFEWSFKCECLKSSRYLSNFLSRLIIFNDVLWIFIINQNLRI